MSVRRTETAEAVIRRVRVILRELDANPSVSKADAIAGIKEVLGEPRVPFVVLHDRDAQPIDWSAA